MRALEVVLFVALLAGVAMAASQAVRVLFDAVEKLKLPNPRWGGAMAAVARWMG